MNDSIFGEMEFKYGWRRKEIFEIWGKKHEVTLVVSGSENKPILVTQKEAYMNFIKFDKVKISDIENAIYSYYLSVCDEYRNMLEDDADECAPLIGEVKELEKLVKPIELVVLKIKDVQEIGIIFECTWDIDAGLAVRIENDKIINVGTQHIAL